MRFLRRSARAGHKVQEGCGDCLSLAAPKDRVSPDTDAGIDRGVLRPVLDGDYGEVLAMFGLPAGHRTF